MEQDRYGRILMSPAPARHSVLQRRFIGILEEALGGIALPECPVSTPEGTKVADVGWMEEAFMKVHQNATTFSVAPAICVEIMSKSNTQAEIEEKAMLYLAKGAQEVWVHERTGTLRWFGHEGERAASAMVPGVPARVEL
ncbi:MAG: Uma2 family endonuclease [Bacteroidota bacterium]